MSATKEDQTALDKTAHGNPRQDEEKDAKRIDNSQPESQKVKEKKRMRKEEKRDKKERKEGAKRKEKRPPCCTPLPPSPFRFDSIGP